jgi:HTH-type transcriptional regulator/antitoxin HipB
VKHILLTSAQLGQLLQSARKASGYSQARLAPLAGLSQSRLSKLEQNPGAITVDQLLALCSGLGLELALQQRGSSDLSPAGDLPAAPPEW